MHKETLASEIIAELQETADRKKQLIDLINNIEKPELIDYLLGLVSGIIEKWGESYGLSEEYCGDGSENHRRISTEDYL